MQELQAENDELSTTLESISDLADEADDAALTREEIIAKVREIQELSAAEEEEQTGEET